MGHPVGHKHSYVVGRQHDSFRRPRSTARINDHGGLGTVLVLNVVVIV